MNEFFAAFKQMMDADIMSAWVMAHGGLYLVALIIFAETGLFVGFFLPGDSLLFITGLIIATSPAPFANDAANLIFWMSLLSVAGIIGNSVGYWFGVRAGPLLFEKRDTWIFKKKHLMQAHDFYEKRGGAAIILARFLPVVRTFAPIVAGVVAMDKKKFFFYNVVGCIAWIVSMTLLGYFLGTNEWVKHNLEKIVIALVLITTGPVLFKMIFGKRKQPIQAVVEDMVDETISKK